MKTTIKRSLLCLYVSALLSVPALALSANLYVRDGATGTTCADWGANACDQLSSAETLAVRGDTIYVADGTYNGITFDVAVSGTTRITIKKATAASHGTETGWSSTYGDGQATIGNIDLRTGYLTVDGVARNASNWEDSSAYGFILNGGAVSGYAVSAGNIYAPAGVEIAYSYIPGPWASVLGSRLIYSVYFATGFHLHHSLLSGAGQNHIRSGASNINMIIEYNYFDTNFSSAAAHGESIQTLGNSGGTVRYNVFDNTAGTCAIVLNSVANWAIYGNVFKNNMLTANNGVIGVTSGETADSILIYNNTFVDGRSNFGCIAGGTCTNWDFRNNIIIASTDAAPEFSSGFTTNSYNAGDVSFGTNFQTIATSIFTSYAGDSFTLATGTTAGATLASPYTLDLSGTTRGSDGTWDRGAYEYGADTPVLTSPLNLTISRPVTFEWEAYTGARKYQIQVDDNSDFSSPEVDVEIDCLGLCDATDTTYETATDDLAPSTTYYWHVRALR